MRARSFADLINICLSKEITLFSETQEDKHMTGFKTLSSIHSDSEILSLESVPAYLNHWRKTTPESPALIIVGRDNSVPQLITYEELFQRACRMAQFLFEQGLCSGDRLGIFVNRDERLIVTMLAASCSHSAKVIGSPPSRSGMVAPS